MIAPDITVGKGEEQVGALLTVDCSSRRCSAVQSVHPGLCDVLYPALGVVSNGKIRMQVIMFDVWHACGHCLLGGHLKRLVATAATACYAASNGCSLLLQTAEGVYILPITMPLVVHNKQLLLLALGKLWCGSSLATVVHTWVGYWDSLW